MDFKRLDKFYEELKKSLQEAEEAIKTRIDKEKQEDNEKTASLMFAEMQKVMALESNHKSLSQEIMFLVSEIIGASIEHTFKDFIKTNEPKNTVQ